MNEINIYLFTSINDLGKHYTYLNPFMVFIAEYTAFLLAIGVVLLWFTRRQKDRIMVICASITFLFSEVLGKVAGKLHFNQQPFAELPYVNQLIEKAINNSFPSDHTMLFFSFCITFTLFRRGWRWIWITLAVLVGISRIWVGVHYPADVMVGAMISIISALVVFRVVPNVNLIKTILRIYEKYEGYILPSKAKTTEIR